MTKFILFFIWALGLAVCAQPQAAWAAEGEHRAGDKSEPLLLPHPSVYGLKFGPDSPAGKPTVVKLQATNLQLIDRSIDHITLTQHFDWSQVYSEGTRAHLFIEACDENCQTRSVLFEFHSETPEKLVIAPSQLIVALSDDLKAGQHATSTCAAKPNSQLAGGAAPAGVVGRPAPGQPGFWRQVPCEDQADSEQSERASLFTQLVQFSGEVPAYRQLCDVYLESPRDFAACQGRLTTAQESVALAGIKVLTAAVLTEYLKEVTLEAMREADQIGLGGAVIPQVTDAIYLAILNTLAGNFGIAASTQANQAMAALTAAVQSVRGDPVLEPVNRHLSAILGLFAGSWRAEHNGLVQCYYRIVKWITQNAAIGFAIRLNFGLGPGPGPLAAPLGVAFASSGSAQPKALIPPSSSVVYDGPYNPRSVQTAIANPIVVNIDQLPPHLQDLTLYEEPFDYGYWPPYPYRQRFILAGYDSPAPWERLGRDVIGPEPFTLFPIVIASADTLVEDVLYPAGRYMVWQETDAYGTPLSGDFATCLAGKPLPLPPGRYFLRYCPFGFPSTGTPDQITAGMVFSRYYTIYTGDGIIGPSTGEPLEDWSGFTLQVHKRAEGPLRCHSWSVAQQRWVWDDTLPGCGISG